LADEAGRHALLDAARTQGAPRRAARGSTPRVAHAVDAVGAPETEADDAAITTEGDAPKKRRRRRRKPAAAEGGESAAPVDVNLPN
ncbi:MAG: polynucleotide adenylyltransferase PcnB, partial [Pseudomonadota bacterium]